MRLERRAKRLLCGAWPAALVLAAGCAVGPNFHRPAAPPVNGYIPGAPPRETVSAAVAGGAAQRLLPDSIFPLSGGRYFTPLPSIHWSSRHCAPIRRYRRRSHRCNRRSTSSRPEKARCCPPSTPTRRLHASACREQPSVSPGVSHLFTLRSASVSVSYLFDLWGGTRRQIETLAAQSDYQRFELEASYLGAHRQCGQRGDPGSVIAWADCREPTDH